MVCIKCGQDKKIHPRSKNVCVDCTNALLNRNSQIRKNNEGWLDVCKDAGLEPWEKQPGETEWEYTIWLHYRDAYPGKRLMYPELAERSGATYGVVKDVARRWDFQARLQLWIKHCDQITLAQRRGEILDMNKEHIDMAHSVNSKLAMAIERLNPAEMKPAEVVALARFATDLERKARLDTVSQEQLRRQEFVDTGEDSNPELKKMNKTKQQDLSQVVDILLKAGALGDITQIAVRQTTELAVKGNNNEEAHVRDVSDD